MKKILILGTNDNIANEEAVLWAKKHDVYSVVTDWNPPEKSKPKRMADEYWMISTTDFDALENKCREVGIDGVFGGTDFAVDVAIELSTRLGLPYYCSAETWAYSRDKAAFKKKCKEYGVPVAKDFFVSQPIRAEEIEGIDYPVVIKPVDKSGNLGISFCYNKHDFKEMYNKAVDMSESGNVVVEKMLTGREYTAFYVLAEGEARLLNFYAMYSQPGCPSNCYSVSTSQVGEKQMSKYLSEVNPSVKKLLKGIGCRDGVAWLEFMTDEFGNYYALEIGQRLSGEMIWVPLSKVTAFDALDWMLNYAVNGKNDIAKLPEDQESQYTKCACGYILWSSKAGTCASVEGIDVVKERLQATIHQIIIPGKQIQEHRYCAVIAFASDNIGTMLESIRYVNDTVKVVDTENENMVIYYDSFDEIYGNEGTNEKC